MTTHHVVLYHLVSGSYDFDYPPWEGEKFLVLPAFPFQRNEGCESVVL